MPWIKPPSNTKKDSLRAIFVPLPLWPGLEVRVGQPLLARGSISLQWEFRFVLELSQELVDRKGHLVAALPAPDVERAGLQLLVPDHRHVGNLLELGVADLRLHPLRLAVDLDPQVFLAEAFRQLVNRF